MFEITRVNYIGNRKVMRGVVRNAILLFSILPPFAKGWGLLLKETISPIKGEFLSLRVDSTEERLHHPGNQTVNHNNSVPFCRMVKKNTSMNMYPCTLRRLDKPLLPQCFQRETNFMISCLLTQRTKSSQKGLFS